MSLPTLVLQDQVAGINVDPIVAMMAAAISALFTALMLSVRGRTEVCEAERKSAQTRIETLLTSDAEKTSTLRELGATVSKSAEVTIAAVSAAQSALEESGKNGRKLDQVLTELAAGRSESSALRQQLAVLESTNRALEQRVASSVSHVRDTR